MKTDWHPIATRILGYAEDADGNALTYTANSDNQGTYGVIPYVLNSALIKTQAQLESVADKLIEVMKTPRVYTSAEVFDLSKSDSPLDFSHESLDLMTLIRFVHPDSGVSIADRVITKLEVDLKDPAAVKIWATNPENADPNFTPVGGGAAGGLGPILTPDDGGGMIDSIIQGLEEIENINNSGGGQGTGGGGGGLPVNLWVRRYTGNGSPSLAGPGDSAEIGDRYIDTSNNHVYYYDGSDWQPESHLEA